MKKTLTVLVLGLLTTAAMAQNAGPPANAGNGGGPWWQSASAAAQQNTLRGAQRELWALHAAQPRDEQAIAAKTAEVRQLREALYQLRDRDLAARGGCPYAGQPDAQGGGGPWWQSDPAAALQDQVRQAQQELSVLPQADPQDAQAIAAQQAKVDQLRTQLRALRVQELAARGTCPNGGRGPGAGNGQGNGPRDGTGNGRGRGRGARGGCRWQQN